MEEELKLKLLLHIAFELRLYNQYIMRKTRDSYFIDSNQSLDKSFMNINSEVTSFLYDCR